MNGCWRHISRTRRGAEVDFVLSVGREIWGIEVKASRHVDTRDLKGLGTLADHAKRVTRRFVVYLGARRQTIDGVEAVPIEDFLADLPA